MSQTAATPVTTSERIELLDVLRGVALFGIFVVNLPLIGLPFSEAMSEASVWEAGNADTWTAALVRMLAENKFMALFSTLFGIGPALQLDRAASRGVRLSSFYPRRLLVLAVFGVCNAVLIFFGDILLPYAIAGTVLYLMRERTPRAMIGIAAGFLLIGVTLSVVVEGGLLGDFGGEGGEGERELDRALAEGSFYEGSVARGQIYLFWLFLSSIIAFNWRILALFFLGAALMRLGWASRDKAAQHRRAMVVGLSLGVVMEGGSLLLHGREGLSAGLRVTDVLLHQLGGLALSAGYAGAVATWCWSGGFDRLRRAIACTGRMALTNYLGQNLVAGLIFYGHGLGMAGALSRPAVFAASCGIYACQVALSSWWMGRASSGPFERLWRWLTYPRRAA